MTRTRRIHKKSKICNNTVEDGVLALRYLNYQHVESGYFGVWWDDNKTYTEEPWANLVNIGEDFLQDLRDTKPGQKVMLTGKRRRCDVLELPAGDGLLYQDREGYCSLNAVRNLVTLPEELVDAIKKEGPMYSHTAMSRQIHRSVGCPIRLDKVKCSMDKLRFLQGQTEGLFVVYFEGHCLSWDANRRVILDTDPMYPDMLAIDDKTIEMLNIRNVSTVYRIVTRGRK